MRPVNNLWTTVHRLGRTRLVPLALLVLPLVSTVPSPVCAQGPWLTFSQRTHSELRWRTLETPHFEILYHQGLEATAEQAAAIAEAVYGPVTRQMATEPHRRTSIMLTRQDEIVNGYAENSGQIFIWVDANDGVTSFSGTEKWLRKVIAHEFQHVVCMEAMRSWISPWDLYFVPGWFLEGTAEYFTESWGIYRSDATVRAMTLRNRLGDLDPHDEGFAKVLYLAREYGDSTLVKLVKHRTGFRTFSFDEAFRKATGKSVTAFERDWRRTMQGHYFGTLAEKEGVKDTGSFLRMPLPRVWGIAWSPDSTRFAVVGATTEMRDRGLFVVSADSARRGREVDYGTIDSRPAWSPDGKSLAYARYHRGAHGSLIWDLYRLDLTGEGRGVKARGRRWLTRNERARDPSWSPDGREIVYLAQRGATANLYLRDAGGGGTPRPVTGFTGDVQVLTPRFSPDGRWIAFTVFDETSGPDIAVVRKDGTGFRHVTRDTLYDTGPIWSEDGRAIYFTSDHGGIANLYRVDFDPEAGEADTLAGAETDGGTAAAAPVVEGAGNPVVGSAGSPVVGSASPPAIPSAAIPPAAPLTDVGEGLWGVDRLPGTDSIVALTLNSVDSARVVVVSGDRRVEPSPLAQRPDFIAWRTHHPDIAVPRLDSLDARKAVESGYSASRSRPYRAWREVRPLLWGVLPSASGIGGIAIVNDALGRHIIALAGGVDWNGRDPAYQLTYVNATQAPVLDLSLYSHVRSGLRMYDRHLLSEDLRGGEAGMTFSYNRGERLSANHRVRLSAKIVRRKPHDPERFADSSLPVPESGRVGLAGIEYQWLSRRPHRANAIVPRQGTGVAVTGEASHRRVYGDFSYRKGSAEFFANRRLPFPGWVAFARTRVDAIGGRPPAQEVVGVTRDDGFYLPPGAAFGAVVSSLVEPYETARLRGWPHNWLGTRALWGTFELRHPIGGGLPVNVFGISPGRISASFFVDYASVWSGGDRAARTWRATEGAELDHEIRLGGEALFVGAWGVGQPWREWRKGRTDHAEGYFRAALVNPF